MANSFDLKAVLSKSEFVQDSARIDDRPAPLFPFAALGICPRSNAPSTC